MGDNNISNRMNRAPTSPPRSSPVRSHWPSPAPAAPVDPPAQSDRVVSAGLHAVDVGASLVGKVARPVLQTAVKVAGAAIYEVPTWMGVRGKPQAALEASAIVAGTAIFGVPVCAGAGALEGIHFGANAGVAHARHLGIAPAAPLLAGAEAAAFGAGGAALGGAAAVYSGLVGASWRFARG